MPELRRLTQPEITNPLSGVSWAAWNRWYDELGVAADRAHRNGWAELGDEFEVWANDDGSVRYVIPPEAGAKFMSMILARVALVSEDYRDALKTIRGPEDRGPWIEVYRRAGGGYEGLQAIAQAALDKHGNR